MYAPFSPYSHRYTPPRIHLNFIGVAEPVIAARSAEAYMRCTADAIKLLIALRRLFVSDALRAIAFLGAGGRLCRLRLCLGIECDSWY